MNTLLKTKVTNPLDELFNIQSSHLEDDNEYVNTTKGELAALDSSNNQKSEKDIDDIDIDNKLDNIHDTAINTFQNQMAYTEIIEPRYAARNAEVAASYLNIALNAIATKAKVKDNRKKSSTFIPFSNGNSNGNVVASREDIMRLISVDAEIKKL
jgi:hypothetical protein